MSDNRELQRHLLLKHKLARRTTVRFSVLLCIETVLHLRDCALKGHMVRVNFCAILLCLWHSEAVCCAPILAK